MYIGEKIIVNVKFKGTKKPVKNLSNNAKQVFKKS